MRGGVLTLRFDESFGLEAESLFEVPAPLEDSVLLQVLEAAIAQWSDGVGSGDDVISGIPNHACPDRDLVLSGWEDGDRYRVITSWWHDFRTIDFELMQDAVGRRYRKAKFVE